MASMEEILRSVGAMGVLPQMAAAAPQNQGTGQSIDLGNLTPEQLRKLQELIGQSIPRLSTPMQRYGQFYSPPSGMAYTGGVSFKPDERADILQNGLILATTLAKELGKVRAKPAPTAPADVNT